MYDFNNNEFPVASTDSVFDSSIFDNEPFNKPIHINLVKEKLFCFEYENLDRIYNIPRFPNRVRRYARVLKKYNFFGNIAIVIGYKHFEYLEFKRGTLNFIVENIAELVDLPKSSIKAKISQLKKYVETDDKNGASKGIINMYEEYKYIEYNELYSILSNHEKYFNLKKAFTDLLNNLPQNMLFIKSSY